MSETQVQSVTKGKKIIIKFVDSHDPKFHIFIKPKKGRATKISTLRIESTRYLDIMLEYLQTIPPTKQYTLKSWGRDWQGFRWLYHNPVKVWVMNKSELLKFKEDVSKLILNDNEMSKRGKKLSLRAFVRLIDSLLSLS